ncbi:hypothetical protein [Luteococcus peritonei]|uniref:Uncharacterized protein n=1 Tax=Luteococcus peritonei TaxID=88874 RepID=A0ABW4RZ87_9ACTN
MAETLKRHRESAAWLVLGVSALYIVISLVRWGHALSRGAGLAEASRGVGGSSLSIPLVLICLVAALACALIRPATGRARTIVRTAALLVGLAALLQAIFLLAGLFGAPKGIFGLVLEVLGGALEVALKALAASLLWRAARSTPEPERAAVEPVAETPPAPARRASWDAEDAVGAVWTRAGDAASGAQASGYGQSGRHSGWDAALQQPELEAPAKPAARGPWATAGELATDPSKAEQIAPEAEIGADEQADVQKPRGGWDPAPRN